MKQSYFNPEVFRIRQQRFLKEIGPGSLAVLFAAPHAKRNADNHYEYRTCSNFYYLTGYSDEEAVAIFQPGAKEPYRLFVLPNNAEKEMWEGKRYGVEGSKKQFNPDACYAVEDFDKIFRASIKEAESIYYAMGDFAEWDDRVLGVLRSYVPNLRAGDKPFSAVKKIQDILGKMRLVKDDAEAALMRKNCRNSALAYKEVMATTKPGMYEYQVGAKIAYEFTKGGAETLAYGSIIAGGNNACVLHYKTNRDQLKDGTLLLIDAGGEMGHFASDITRTFPVNGKFTTAQKQIYEIVLRSQKAAIADCRVGVKFVDVHKKASEVLVEGLLSLGLLKGTKEEHLKPSKEFVSFYPHRTGHWIGLDVHDAGAYMDSSGQSVPLAAGNCLTVEPGIYIDQNRTDVPVEFRGIGIRIEDDILVTNGEPENLTQDAPKEVAEIEALVGTKA
jgi:Xaa-Pro aminopeptidase